MLVNGSVAFVNNTSTGMAQSGIHPGPGGARASAAGGAIANNGGSLTFSGAAIGHCSFTGNTASATAGAIPPFIGSASSAGGAIVSSGMLVLPVGACSFSANRAQVDSDLHLYP